MKTTHNTRNGTTIVSKKPIQVSRNTSRRRGELESSSDRGSTKRGRKEKRRARGKRRDTNEGKKIILKI